MPNWHAPAIPKPHHGSAYRQAPSNSSTLKHIKHPAHVKRSPCHRLTRHLAMIVHANHQRIDEPTPPPPHRDTAPPPRQPPPPHNRLRRLYLEAGIGVVQHNEHLPHNSPD